MRKFIFLFLLSALTVSVFGQTQLIHDFEDPAPDTTFWGIVSGDNTTDTTKMDLTHPTDNSVEGASIRADWRAEDSEGWGGFVKFEHYAPDSMLYDWSAYDTVSFWYYNETPQDVVGDVHVRFNLYEASDAPDTTSNSNDMEFYYSFHYGILDDSTSAWHKISIPLIAGDYWNGEGFNRTGWSGIAGNEKLDTDKIKGYTFEFSIGGGGDGSTSEGIVLFDELELSGLAEDPWLIFNGKTLDPAFEYFQWGSSLEIIDGAGEDPKTNALKWTQSDGWSGAGWNIDPAHDIGFRWAFDSLRFKLKTSDAFGTSRLQFESGGDGAVGYAFTPIADGEWNDYAIALRDFYVVDGKANFDTTNITVFQMMAEGNGVPGYSALYDFIWTGNPEIDLIPPEAPTNVAGIGGSYQNLITWVDVPNEDGAVYNVLYSMNPITSLDDEGLESVATNIAEGVQIATHTITAPLVDTEVTYYYAVYAIDASGNDGALGVTSGVTNDAKGIATIAPAFTGFTADGDLSEWSGIMPIAMKVSDGSGAIVTNTTIDSDADLSLDAWVGFDDDYLYFAADVEDDIIQVDSTDGETWMYDGVDLFIGLYNQSGPKHTAYQTGEEPDLHFRFNEHQLFLDNDGGVLSKQGVDYYWKTKFPTGYVVEGRVSLDTLAVKRDSEKFVPIVGMKIPIDYSINDADGSRREGIMTLSKINEDQSWGNPSLWTHTWIGDKMVGVNDNPVSGPEVFALAQNYPNPFNPSTVISYSLAKAGMVTLKIYNILGQEVLTLVNTNQNVGQYQVKFDASNLSTGLYVYRIQSGDFVATKKMMLLK